nr:hypothetical protein [Sulfurimonas sp. MAG313]
MISGNYFIDLLYVDVREKNVVNMREELGAPKPLIDKDFKEDGGNSIELADYKVELFFKDSCRFDGRNSTSYGKSDIVFGGIVFGNHSKLEPPFGIEMGSNYEAVVKSIGREQDYNSKRMPQRMWKFTREDGKDYLLYAVFEKDYSEVLSIRLITYTKAVEKANKHNPEAE